MNDPIKYMIVAGSIAALSMAAGVVIGWKLAGQAGSGKGEAGSQRAEDRSQRSEVRRRRRSETTECIEDTETWNGKRELAQGKARRGKGRRRKDRPRRQISAFSASMRWGKSLHPGGQSRAQRVRLGAFTRKTEVGQTGMSASRSTSVFGFTGGLLKRQQSVGARAASV